MLCISSLAVPGTAAAGNYWVSPTGAAATWAACQSATPLSGTAACTLAQANANAAAGDTVYLRGGAYTFSIDYNGAISPAHNGSSAASMVVFSAYTGETPVISGGSPKPGGIALYGNSYIKVTGITFHNFYQWGSISNVSHHNEISYNTFYNDTGDEATFTHPTPFLISEQNGGNWTGYSSHNWIHHNSFSRYHGSTDPCVEGSDLIRIGVPLGTGSTAMLNLNNTVENNFAEYGGHAIMDQYGKYTVVRNNVFHNEPWRDGTGCVGASYWPTDQYTNTSYAGKYSHRIMQVSRDTGAYQDAYVLVEGNRIGHSGSNPNNDGADGLDLAASSIVARYNYVYDTMQTGVYFKYNFANNNRVYNNTIYHNGYGYPPYSAASCPQHSNVCPNDVAGISFAAGTGNVVKNNLVWQNNSYIQHSGRDIIARSGGAPGSTYGVISNNWLSSMADPLFTNPDLTSPASTTLPDLSLQSSSPAIDGGAALTTAVGAGAGSSTLIVADALYFQDGTWGSDLARGVTFFPDWIAIGTVGNTVQISSINYGTNTITLASPKTWTDGARIWLYKKSDGAVVLAGAAPDFGASEYLGTGTRPLAPTNLQTTVR
jgi:hypothetical protein